MRARANPTTPSKSNRGCCVEGSGDGGGWAKNHGKTKAKKWERHSAAYPQKRMIYYKNQCEITLGASSENVIKIMVFGAFVVSSNT